MSALRRAWHAIRTRPALRLTLEAALLLGFVYAVDALRTRELRARPLPAFALPDRTGRIVRSESFRDVPTMLVVWAPWCGVCRVESQNVSWVQKLVGDRARVVSLVAAYDRDAEVEAFVRAAEVDYPVLLGGRDGARVLGVTSFPTALFLDENGRVRRAASGYTTTLGLLLRLFL